MIARTRRVTIVALLLATAACGSDADPSSRASTTAATSAPTGTEKTTPVESTVAPPATTVAPGEDAGFPIAAFAAIREDPVTAESAAEFQAALNEMAGDGGISATVMTAEGTWSGTAGTADGVRDLQIDDQFAIGSTTKSAIAAQVMQLVEAGDLSLDDLADEYLPPDLDFDTNKATIRHLLSHRSGLPDHWPVVLPLLSADLLRVWTPTDLLDLVPTRRGTLGTYEYGDTNYLLLGLIIEQIRGLPLAQVLRSGVLAIDGVERVIYQPDEKPSEPMAMPGGGSTAALVLGGGYLPSLTGATANGPAAAIASDSPSLARWWRALCAGEIVSPASLTEMTTPAGTNDDGHRYGLGLFSVAEGYGPSVGHAGWDTGFSSFAACLPEEGAVVIVLANSEIDDIQGMARPLVLHLRTD